MYLVDSVVMMKILTQEVDINVYISLYTYSYK